MTAGAEPAPLRLATKATANLAAGGEQRRWHAMAQPRGTPDDERRLRRLAAAAASREVADPSDQGDGGDEDRHNESARAQRLQHQALWVDLQVRRAIERGDFDNLPGAGKPIRGLGATHDPHWWVKSLIEREKITGVLPPALALRREDAELESRLDGEPTEAGVQVILDDFNRRIVDARRQLLGGPPVVTRTRDVDAEVAAWRARRADRLEQLRRARAERMAAAPPVRTRWLPRWSLRRGGQRVRQAPRGDE
jgi:hypothetical protein